MDASGRSARNQDRLTSFAVQPQTISFSAASVVVQLAIPRFANAFARSELFAGQNRQAVRSILPLSGICRCLVCDRWPYPPQTADRTGDLRGCSGDRTFSFALHSARTAVLPRSAGLAVWPFASVDCGPAPASDRSF